MREQQVDRAVRDDREARDAVVVLGDELAAVDRRRLHHRRLVTPRLLRRREEDLRDRGGVLCGGGPDAHRRGGQA